MRHILSSLVILSFLVSCSDSSEQEKNETVNVSKLDLIQLNNTIISNKTISDRLQNLLFGDLQLCMYEVHTAVNIEKYARYYTTNLLEKVNDNQLIEKWKYDSTITLSSHLSIKDTEYSILTKEYIKICSHNYLEYSNFESSLEQKYSDYSIEEILSSKNNKAKEIKQMTLSMFNLIDKEINLFQSLSIIHNYNSFLLSKLNEKLSKYEFNTSALSPIFQFDESYYSEDSTILKVSVGFIDTTMNHRIQWHLNPDITKSETTTSEPNNTFIIPKTKDPIYGVISYSYRDIEKWKIWKKQ
jgi:hypothetical protein